ncbi:MAG: serine/threonine protein kinase [Gammaproteobacteria bacterium]|nr:serine/threonine protein kinase [Gammaproteobacteria bacterium]
MSQNMQPYEGLGPDQVLDCIEATGRYCTGGFLALNSYENRVYQVALEDREYVVAKFYRPGRWTNAAILEEHAFALELADAEVPVVAPLVDADGKTLHEINGYRFALFPRRGGRSPELDNDENLRWLGRFLGRMHMVGAQDRFKHREKLGVSRAQQATTFVQESDFLPSYLRDSYRAVANDLLAHIERCFDSVFDLRMIRLHGDCHPGNILWTDAGPHFVDLDDAVMGPAIQDLWMLLSGYRDEQSRQMQLIIEGYQQFREFDPQELLLIEALRSIRMIHYAAWLARRWDDPAFPQAFPWFASPRFWEEHVQELKEQLALIAEPAISIAY